MRKKRFIFLTLIFSILFLVACSDEDNKDEIIPTSNFVQYSPYNWKLSNENVFYVINSGVEMYQHIESEYDVAIAPNMPDFNQYTLLLGDVKTRSGISKIETKLVKHNSVDYTFEIYVWTNLTTVAENRMVAVTVPKLAENVQIVKKVVAQF